VVTEEEHFPAYVVWELTLRCDHACAHCGSRAGKARDDELTTAKALEVVSELAALGAREVVLIGGEAYLHEGFFEIIGALKAQGIRPTMTTGGRGVTPDLAKRMKEAGVHSVSVSVDGLAEQHDAIRNARGSFESATAAIGHLKDAGLLVAANTNINRVNAPVLEPLYDALKVLGIVAWQVQITVPLGRAADRPQMLLQPYDLLELVPRLADIKRRAFHDGVRVMPGNNLGYFGPEEALLRSVREGGQDHWRGCQAGKRVMGIESDGGVKGCPSLQSAAYVGGTLQERSLDDIWSRSDELAFNRARTQEDLWGYCASCPFAEMCLAGCTFTSHALFGRPGNNPYCHFRARAFDREGKRERLVPAEAASGRPFDHGLFELVVEHVGSDEPAAPSTTRELVQLTRRPRREVATAG
jgi:radical SAM protein with 4Fe4S-binding SPASM domain